MTFADSLSVTDVVAGFLLAVLLGLVFGAMFKRYLGLDEENRREFRIIAFLVLTAGWIAGFGQSLIDWMFK